MEERTADIRRELDTALRQVEELRSARERQATTVENIIQQQDMYKSLATAETSPGKTTSTPAPPDGSQGSQQTPGRREKETEKVAELEKQLVEVKKEFWEYKVEKNENDRMANESLERTRQEGRPGCGGRGRQLQTAGRAAGRATAGGARL